MAKIRAGFVSNSSSSSFCIAGYGTWVKRDNEILTQILNKNNIKIDDPYYEGTSFCTYDENGNLDECENSILLNDNEKYNLGISEYGGSVCIIARPGKLDESKTINEIKKEIKKDLLDLGFKEEDINIEFIVEGYSYDS